VPRALKEGDVGQIFSGLWGGGGDAPPPAGAGAAPPAPAAAPDLEEAAARRRAKNRLKRQRQRQRKRELRAAAEASRSDTASEAGSSLSVRFAPPSAFHAPTAATGDELDERPARSGAGASSDEEDGDAKDREETAAADEAEWRTVSRRRSRSKLSPSTKQRRRRRREREEAMLSLQEDQERLRRRGRVGIADQLGKKVVIAASDPTTGHVVAAHSHRAEALHPHVRSYLQARFDAAGGGKKVDARSADGAGSDPGSCAEWHALDALHRRVMLDHQRAHGGRAMTEAQSHAALAGYRFNHPRRLAAPSTDIRPCRTHCQVWAEDMISDSSDEE
jgi:hypothetical protein